MNSTNVIVVNIIDFATQRFHAFETFSFKETESTFKSQFYFNLIYFAVYLKLQLSHMFLNDFLLLGQE